MSNTMKTLAAVAALSLTLAACGGGGGGGGGSSSTGGTSTPPAASNTASTLLASYTPPADIVADVQVGAAYTGPAFSTGSSALQSNCSNPALVSSTVVNAPDVVVFSAGASLKAQELAADLFEQAVPTIRAAFGRPSTGVAFDGVNQVVLCVDPTMGQGQTNQETGTTTAITGQTGQGLAGPVMQVLSADSPNFAVRFAGATSFAPYEALFVHEGTHAMLFSLSEPFGGGLPTFLQEGVAQMVAQQPMGTRASVLAIVQSTDVIAPVNANADTLDAYPAYLAVADYLTSPVSSDGLGFPLTSMPSFLATYRAQALASCDAPIPSGLIEPANLTAGMPPGTYNSCGASPAGLNDPRLGTAFNAAWDATIKDSTGAPLLLYSTESPNSLESTLLARLEGFLPN